MGVIEQESYLSYIEKEIKKILQRPIPLLNLNYQIYPTILKNRMQRTSVTTTEKQSAVIRNKAILHTLSIICELVDVSNKLLLSSLSNILKAFGRVDRDFTFSLLQKFGYGDKFICMIKVAYTNMQSKNEINGLFFDIFALMQVVR